MSSNDSNLLLTFTSIKHMHAFLIFLGYTFQCPTDFPYLERHRENNHGDVCRKSEGDTSWHECPDGCTKAGQSPWCKAISSDEPCRTPKGN